MLRLHARAGLVGLIDEVRALHATFLHKQDQNCHSTQLGMLLMFTFKSRTASFFPRTQSGVPTRLTGTESGILALPLHGSECDHCCHHLELCTSFVAMLKKLIC